MRIAHTEELIDLKKPVSYVDEKTPLLNNAEEHAPVTLTQSIKEVLGLSFAVMCYATLHPMYFLMSSLAASRLGEDELAGFGLGSLTIGIIGISIAVAFNGGLLTFTSAASGQKDYRACIVYRNRAIFLDICIYLFLSIPIIYIDEIYVFLGQQEMVAYYAAMYCKIVFPSIIFFFIFYVQSFYASAI